DADLRRPSVHQIAGVPNLHGFSSLLSGHDTIAEAVVPGAERSLSILPSGPIPPNPAELLSSPLLPSLLEQFRQAYDLVLLDSAPVLGLADSPQLAALADAVLI